MERTQRERAGGRLEPAAATRAPLDRAGRGGMCFAQKSRERHDVVRSVVAPAVDEEAGGPGDVARVGAVDVLGDAWRVRPCAQLVPEPFHVEAELKRRRNDSVNLPK